MAATAWMLAGLSLAIVLGPAPVHASQPQSFSGLASFYSADYSGPTADGEQYDPQQFTAAHPSLPFGTLLRVTDLRNGRSVTVVVNDRGPFVENRVLDLSMAAAKSLDIVDRGIAKVTAVVEHVRVFHLRALFSRQHPAR